MARGNPGFTLLAIATLALGIGSTAIIYSVVRDILLDPFPYVHQDRMVDVVLRDVATTRVLRGAFSGPEFLDYQEQAKSFEAVLGTDSGSVHYVSDDGAERMRAVWVTPNMFSFLGVAPLYGRAFTEEDGKPSSPCVAELSHRTWIGRLGADPGIVGKTVRLDGKPCTIIGIMPPRFEWHVGDLWIPVPIVRSTSAGAINNRWFQARLRPGVSVEAAEAELSAIARRRAELFPTDTRSRPESTSSRSSTGSSAASEACSTRCSRLSACCCSSPARTSPTCCSHAAPLASASCWCAWHWAPVAPASSASS